MENNPYGFRLKPEETTNQSETTTQASQGYNGNGYYQQTANPGNGYGAYSYQQDADPFAGVVDLTDRKKKALVISFGVMAGGLVLSVMAAVVSLLIAVIIPEIVLPILFGSFVLEIGMVFATNHCINKNKVGLGIACYVLFALANGTTFMSIFLNYAPASILGLFLLTAIIFGITTVVALIIPHDISRWQTSLVMGLIALLLLSVVYIFLPFTILDLFICAFGIVLFIAITIYDIKKINQLATNNTALSIWSVGLFGGMNLYLDFVNLLVKILRIFGKRSN